jgi:hypothetical protein
VVVLKCLFFGGEGGIRTHEPLANPPVFKLREPQVLDEMGMHLQHAPRSGAKTRRAPPRVALTRDPIFNEQEQFASESATVALRVTTKDPKVTVPTRNVSNGRLIRLE